MEEWKKVKISKIAQIIKGKQIDKENIMENGKYYHLNGGITPSNYTNQYNVIENTISISEGGNSCGYVKWNVEKFFSGGHNYTIQNINNEINPKYLYYVLKYNENKIMRLRVGSGLPNIQKKDLENFEIIYPINKQFQKKIIKVLETIEIIIEKEERNLELLENQKKWLLNGVLNKKILLPCSDNSRWKKQKFNYFFKECNFKTSDKEKYPLYSLTIEDGVVPKTERYEREFLVKKEENAYKIVQPHCFVYNPMNVRFGAIKLNKEDFAVSVSGYYNVFEVNNKLTLGFWEEFLVSKKMLNIYESIAIGSLEEKKRVHYSNFEKIEMELPTEEEQIYLSNIIIKYNKLMEGKKLKIEYYYKIRKGLMQKLLTGKVKVNV